MSELAANVLAFGRLLRRLGIDVSAGRSREALTALAAVGVDQRRDVYHALRTTLVSRAADLPIFDAAFAAFWQDHGGARGRSAFGRRTTRDGDAAGRGDVARTGRTGAGGGRERSRRRRRRTHPAADLEPAPSRCAIGTSPTSPRRSWPRSGRRSRRWRGTRASGARDAGAVVAGRGSICVAPGASACAAVSCGDGRPGHGRPGRAGWCCSPT